MAERLASFHTARDGVRKLVVQTSDAVARKAVEELSAEGDKAIANKDAKMLAHVSEQMEGLARQLMQNDPAFWVGFLQHLVEWLTDFLTKR